MPDSLGRSTGSEKSSSAAVSNGPSGVKSPFFDIECCFKVVFSVFFPVSYSILFVSALLSFFFLSVVSGSKFPPLFTRSFVFSLHSLVPLFFSLHSPILLSILRIYLFFFCSTILTNRISLLRFATFVQHKVSVCPYCLVYTLYEKIVERGFF